MQHRKFDSLNDFAESLRGHKLTPFDAVDQPEPNSVIITTTPEYGQPKNCTIEELINLTNGNFSILKIDNDSFEMIFISCINGVSILFQIILDCMPQYEDENSKKRTEINIFGTQKNTDYVIGEIKHTLCNYINDPDNIIKCLKEFCIILADDAVTYLLSYLKYSIDGCNATYNVDGVPYNGPLTGNPRFVYACVDNGLFVYFNDRGQIHLFGHKHTMLYNYEEVKRDGLLLVDLRKNYPVLLDTNNTLSSETIDQIITHILDLLSVKQ